MFITEKQLEKILSKQAIEIEEKLHDRFIHKLIEIESHNKIEVYNATLNIIASIFDSVEHISYKCSFSTHTFNTNQIRERLLSNIKDNIMTELKEITNKSINDYINSEDFIDNIVLRINNKQLKRG